MYRFLRKKIVCMINQFLRVIFLRSNVSIILVIDPFPCSEDNDETLPKEKDGDTSSWLFSSISTWPYRWLRTNTNPVIVSFRWPCLEDVETEEQIDMLFRTDDDVNEFRPMSNQRRSGFWRWKTSSNTER